MGLSVIVSGGIIMVALMTVLYTMPGLVDSVFEIEETSSQVSTLENNIFQTSISIDSLSAESDESWVSFNLNNDGSEKLWNFEEFEIFVTYDTDILGTPTRVTEQVIEYTNTPSSDFKVQRGTFSINPTSDVITEGVDFNACTGDCFIRLSNARLSGGGETTTGGNQNHNRWSVYISDDSGLTTPGGTITMQRHVANVDSRAAWEIWEYIGEAGEPNEMVVLDTGVCTYAGASLTCDGASPGAATNDADVVVFITGLASPIGNLNENAAMLSTSEWTGALGVPADIPRFTRESITASPAVDVSYAIVEFTGSNWNVERLARDGSNQPTSMSLLTSNVGDISRAFTHAQQSNVDNGGTDGAAQAGEKVMLTAPDTITFSHPLNAAGWDADMLEVIWIIRNSETAPGSKMIVQHIDPITRGLTEPRESDGSTVLEEDDWSIIINEISYGLNDTAITSITSQSGSGGNNFPRGALSAMLNNSTAVKFYNSERTGSLDYAFEVTQFPKDSANAGQWYVFNIIDDISSPGILNQGETAQITAMLSNPVSAGGSILVIISTDNGITATNAISIP